MSGQNYEDPLQNVYLTILAFPGTRIVSIAKMVSRSPDTVTFHVRKLAQDGYIGRVRIGCSRLWYDSEIAAKLIEKYQSEAPDRKRQAFIDRRERRIAVRKAKLKRIRELEINALDDEPMVHRTVCANTASKFSTNAVNSVWQFAAQ